MTKIVKLEFGDQNCIIVISGETKVKLIIKKNILLIDKKKLIVNIAYIYTW